MLTKEANTRAEPEGAQHALATVTNALAQIRFGSIQITVHNGKPVQVDVTERHRFQP